MKNAETTAGTIIETAEANALAEAVASQPSRMLVSFASSSFRPRSCKAPIAPMKSPRPVT
jgi:hypothetical protein